MRLNIRQPLELDLDDDFLGPAPTEPAPAPTGTSRRSSTSSVRPQTVRTTEQHRVDPAVIDDDDTFTDIMSIFNRK